MMDRYWRRGFWRFTLVELDYADGGWGDKGFVRQPHYVACYFFVFGRSFVVSFDITTGG